MKDAHNKYLQSFLGVKEYVKKNLKDKVWDVKLSIHATTSTQQLIHQGHLNAPTVDEIAILLPSDDTITQKHMRYVLFCNRSVQKPSLSLNLIFLLFQVYYCQLQAARNYSKSFQTITELVIHRCIPVYFPMEMMVGIVI